MAQNPTSDVPYDYTDLERRATAKKLPDFKKGREERSPLFHLIYAEQLDRKTLDRLCRLATRLRLISKTEQGIPFLANLLRLKSAMLYFTQPSTRTYLSFVRACQYLGMDYAEVRDPSISSSFKGEGDLDALRTFSSYFDVIILRHHEAGFAERAAYMMKFDCDRPVPVISGGAGSDEHPTQALLDVYTLKRSFEERRTNGHTPGPIEGLTVAFVGDIRRGRTVRSLAKLLTLYPDMRLQFVSPPELQMADGFRAWLERKRVDYAETTEFGDVLLQADAVYMTRIQSEYEDAGVAGDIDYASYRLSPEMAARMKPNAIVMHPLPRRDELDVRVDNDHRAMYWRQERNGMWIRSALLAHLLEAEAEINDFYLTRLEEQGY